MKLNKFISQLNLPAPLFNEDIKYIKKEFNNIAELLDKKQQLQ
jgi:hypothetical protein